MLLGGYEKLTLIDYPGKIATTVFTVGCSFRCPFCHNPELVLSEKKNKYQIPEEEFFTFLEKRKGKLEGVCITGGEPLVQKDIIQFIEKIRELGFLVKLDTNGTYPDVLHNLLEKKLLDFVAMDIKSSPQKYHELSGIKFDVNKLKKSIDLIMGSGLNYEFRTTVVPGLHEEGDFLQIAEWIKGAQAYYLQEYREIKILDDNLKKTTKGKTIDLEKIKNKIEGNFGKMGIRR